MTNVSTTGAIDAVVAAQQARSQNEIKAALMKKLADSNQLQAQAALELLSAATGGNVAQGKGNRLDVSG